MRDILTALGCFAVGGLVIYEAADYPKLRGVEMHPGHYPTMLAHILLFLGLVILGNRLLLGGEKKEEDGTDRRRIALLVAALVAYAAVLEWLGYAVSTFLFVLIAVFLFHGSKKISVLTGLVAAVVLTLVFRYLFRAPLPPGLLF